MKLRQLINRPMNIRIKIRIYNKEMVQSNRQRTLKVWYAYQRNQEKKQVYLNNTQKKQHTYIGKEGQFTRKKQRSNNKARVKQYIQDVHNQNQEAKMTNLGVK